MESRTGDVTGVLPYSRVSAPPGDPVAQETSEILAVPAGDLQALAEPCHQTTAILVHAILDRVRAFNSSDLHDEKLVSLGSLSAGLAHELINPAAAIERSASLLDEKLASFRAASLALVSCRLSNEQLAVIDRVRATCAVSADFTIRAPIEQAEREETVEDWLADQRIDTGIVEALADTPVTMSSPDALAASIDGAALSAVLRSLSAGCGAHILAEEIKDAATGIIIAVKGFPRGISGAELTRRASMQAQRLGAESLAPLAVERVAIEGGYKRVTLSDGREIVTRALLASIGMAYREHPAEGIAAHTGAGLYYGAATTEASAISGRRVFVGGGGNSAGQGALYLARRAREVQIVIRREKLHGTMSQ